MKTCIGAWIAIVCLLTVGGCATQHDETVTTKPTMNSTTRQVDTSALEKNRPVTDTMGRGM